MSLFFFSFEILTNGGGIENRRDNKSNVSKDDIIVLWESFQK